MAAQARRRGRSCDPAARTGGHPYQRRLRNERCSPLLAQANTAGTAQDAQKKPVNVVKVTKPSDGQAITVELSHDQPTKIDLTAIAGENFALARIGEKLVFLFDNRSSLAIESFIR